MRAWIDRTNDGLSGMPADGISLPPKKGDFGTSSAGPARRLGYINQVTGRKRGMTRLWHEPADPACPLIGPFSNRPFGVKRFQTIHHSGVDVARGLVLLFGIVTRALPSWDSRTRRNNLSGGLAVRRTAGPSNRTNSPHPSSREGHHPPLGWLGWSSLRVSSYRI